MSTLNFTKNEKEAIIRVLKGIAVADERFAQSEVQLLHRIGHKMNVSEQEFRNADNITLLDAVNMMNNLTVSEKQFVADCICVMASIDGHIHPNEIAIGSFVTEMCNLPFCEDTHRAIVNVTN